LDGIYLVNAAPGNKVSILYSGGGMDVAVSDLPQGFLDQWGITPEKLDRANR